MCFQSSRLHIKFGKYLNYSAGQYSRKYESEWHPAYKKELSDLYIPLYNEENKKDLFKLFF